MKIIVISDTHNQHRSLVLPAGDMIIHCGDVSGRGFENEVYDFINWFEKLDYKYKIFIAGNHDFFFEQNRHNQVDELLKDRKGMIYLNDNGIEIEGIKFWGSPVQPWFYNWAFNRRRGEEIRKHWDLIPQDTDVLITHGPPSNRLDMTQNNEFVGCVDLLNAVYKIKPKFHLFGHIHEDYGRFEGKNTTFINASVLNENYRLVNAPMIIEI